MAAATWDEMEQAYYETTRARREREDAKLNEQYEERREEINRELDSLSRERDKLQASMRAVLESISIQEVERDKLVRRLDEELSHRAALREQEDREKLSWFKQQRALKREPGDSPDTAPPAGSTRSNGRRSSKRDSGGRRSTGGWTSINGAKPAEDIEPPMDTVNIFHGNQRNPMEDVTNGGAKINGDQGSVIICSTDGREVGRIRAYNQPNRYSEALAGLPIRRQVVLREGRTMDADELGSIYTSHSGKKPSKWVSCMVQATGDVQQKPCINCEKGQGVFGECVMIADPTGALPSCGNCEWNHQRCTGANDAVKDGKPKQRHKLPSFPAVAPATPTFEGPQTVLSDRTSKPKSGGRRSLPALSQIVMDQDSAAESTPNAKATEPEDPTEINRSTLLLQHNGRVYTAPPMFAGTPVEKIRPNDSYWNPEWEPLLSIIEPQLQKWHEKLDTLRRTPDAVRHTVFLANRQVNRGQAVVDFLKNDDAEFHPYQFVGKDMMNKFYKTFINYDTLFRLVNVHEELKKFDLDVAPLDWLRQRMYELSIKQGEKFSLSKIVHDLYHDAKLKALREKHGFGNIGRPSGYKLGSRTNPDGTPKEKTGRQSSGGSTRRKRVSSIKQRIDDPNSEIFQPPPQEEFLQPVTPRLQKRQRLEPAPPPEPVVPPADPYEDDLEYSGWTSTDSFSAGRIMHLDWRVYQIKTTSLTTSTEVTQYWTWKNDENAFEHQVLRDVFPKVTWGYYQKPIDFNLRLEDIKEIEYASDSQKIVVHLHEGGKDTRGSVLAHFKRERTKRRFLAFARKKGVQLVKSTSVDVEHAWKTMVSDELPDDDSDE